MYKTSKGRVADTRQYIEGYAASGLPLNVRMDIGALITTRLPRTTAQQRQTFDQLSAGMSVKQRIPVAANRGTEVERDQRRAIVLLWSVMAVTQPVPAYVAARIQRGMTLGTGALAAELTAVMQKAAVVASNPGAAHVFQTDFLANPLAFITLHRVMIRGSTTGRAKLIGPAVAGMDYRNVVAFYFYYNAGDDRFEFGAGPMGIHGASCLIHSVSIPAVHWSDVENRGVAPTPTLIAPAGFQDLRGVEMAGAGFMATTQFTGCAFCYCSAGGVMFAAHVSPAGDPAKPVLTGQVLANQLMGTHVATGIAAGVMSNWPGGAPPPALQVFGNGVGNAGVLVGNGFYPPKAAVVTPGLMRWMTVFGVRVGGVWEIFTQSIDGAGAIMEARRIV